LNRLVIATRNRGKVAEIAGLIEKLGYSVTSLVDASQIPDIVEDADTFEGNAIKKAVETSRIVGCPALADDSGLEVDALGKRPGIHSARYGGDDLSDEQRYLLLLREMRDIPKGKRTARFRCAMAYVEPQNEPKLFHGTFEGKIGFAPVGVNGFGYDPVFIPDGYDITLAEIPPDEKKKISHRAKALAAFVDWLSRHD
jgi:XTP/dITP diphosphohydrolase